MNIFDTDGKQLVFTRIGPDRKTDVLYVADMKLHRN